jgi:ribosomal-protein-alanine N-acetyltransferase
VSRSGEFGGEVLRNLHFHPMNLEVARAVLVWRSQPPYDFYNADPARLSQEALALTDPAMGYYSVWDEVGELVAVRCFGPDARVPGGDYSAEALNTGGGLRPDLTGRGLGG